MSKRARGARNKNPISPFTRITTVLGMDKVKAIWRDALGASTPFAQTVDLANLKHVQIPQLTATEATTVAPSITCQVLSGVSDSYPTHKVGSTFLLHSNSNSL